MVAPDTQAFGDDKGRKRKPHKKSRRGCRNCKLRKVKCDGTRPNCQKCTSYGFYCNFDLATPDLQMSFDGVASLQLPPNPALGVPASLNPKLAISDKDSTFYLDRQSLDRLYRFNRRTVLSLGHPKTTELYQKVTMKLIFEHPYLMHIVQTMTALHDRYFSASPTTRISATEAHHWFLAASLFNQKLSKPIEPDDRDGLWATAVLLGISAFSLIEASKPEEAWPLKPPESTDFDWIDLSRGKAAVWALTDPLRPDSVFNFMARDYKTNYFAQFPTSGFEGIPSQFVQIYCLDENSSAFNNPYYTALRIVVFLLPIKCGLSNVPTFISFVGHMEPDFRRLLKEKDPRALLLMAYWFVEVRNSQWWIRRRAHLEFQAVCMYLEKYYPEETLIHELLTYPKTEFHTGEKMLESLLGTSPPFIVCS
ncbi:hypothetical protein B7494_g5652 [Chlorociboria aeruginascens]|nr:hypothetical protein B7494_g5652 [Chlorociboria aeruginascens]